MANASDVKNNFVNLVAAKMAAGIECAVESWLGRIDRVLNDNHLTTLGRLHAVQEVLQHYKSVAGKSQFKSVTA